jgi:hypothetical protein
MYRLLIAAALCLGLAQPAAAQTPIPPAKILDAPWQEATLSVRDFDPIYTFLTKSGGYEEVARGAISEGQLAYWNLPNAATGKFVLLREPGSDHAHIRLIDLDGVSQQPIRIGARAWDTGGFFSLMMRGKDLESLFNEAIALGFQAESEPIRFLFEPTDGSPPSDLKNVVIKAPDGINFAIYERVSPALSAFWEFDRLSQPFNAMQMVANTAIAEGFYRQELGMESFWASDFIDPKPDYNNFGLPQNLTIEIPRRTRILWPRPGETGRLEIMEFVGLDGRDLAQRAAPPNLGILSVSYPVNNAQRAYDRVVRAGALPKYKLKTFQWPPYGRVQMFTLQSPDGALINVFERPEVPR